MGMEFLHRFMNLAPLYKIDVRGKEYLRVKLLLSLRINRYTRLGSRVNVKFECVNVRNEGGEKFEEIELLSFPR